MVHGSLRAASASGPGGAFGRPSGRPSRLVKLEDFNSLFWPPSRAPFSLKVLVLVNRSLQFRAGGPHVHQHNAGLCSFTVVSFGASRSQQYRTSQSLGALYLINIVGGAIAIGFVRAALFTPDLATTAHNSQAHQLLSATLS
jgi:hypothetical protein